MSTLLRIQTKFEKKNVYITSKLLDPNNGKQYVFITWDGLDKGYHMVIVHVTNGYHATMVLYDDTAFILYINVLRLSHISCYHKRAFSIRPIIKKLSMCNHYITIIFTNINCQISHLKLESRRKGFFTSARTQRSFT